MSPHSLQDRSVVESEVVIPLLPAVRDGTSEALAVCGGRAGPPTQFGAGGVWKSGGWEGEWGG
eukprot:227271-Rhodomonas_salina.1